MKDVPLLPVSCARLSYLLLYFHLTVRTKVTIDVIYILDEWEGTSGRQVGIFFFSIYAKLCGPAWSNSYSQIQIQSELWEKADGLWRGLICRQGASTLWRPQEGGPKKGSAQRKAIRGAVTDAQTPRILRGQR